MLRFETRKYAFHYNGKKLLLFLQSALNVIIRTNILLPLIKPIKN